jgi:hypothetical protein
MIDKRFHDTDFRKASGSGDLGCVEVAMRDGLVGVRDSKDTAGASLTFSRHEWTVFVDGVKAGEFDPR